MTRASLYSEEHFVVLLPGEAERIVTAAEMLALLQSWIQRSPDELSQEIPQQADLTAQAVALRDTACEWELEPGRTAQWYAIRLEK